jgi:CRISPR system Cascade subunit CasE
MTEAAQPYELHRSLMKAFPDKAAGGPGRVLFRLDIDHETGGMSVLVQSEKEPDWGKLNGTTGFITECKSKQFDPEFVQGQMLRFRLRANPTKRVKETGKRQGILEEEAQIDWLRKRGLQSGFEVVDAIVIKEGFAKDKMTDTADKKHDLTMLSVRFDGLLRVIDPETFRHTIECGVGSAKGLGFGLLSLAPYRG